MAAKSSLHDVAKEGPFSAPRSRIMAAERPVGLKEISEIEERSYRVIKHLSDQFRQERRELNVRFSMNQAAEMAGRTPTAIRDAEKQGKLLKPAVSEKGRRIGYTLRDINRIREYFGTLPYRQSAVDEVVVLAVQNFKGGCGKSTVTVHLAQYLAMQGYRVCVIDCDPQASTTALFGFNPDSDVEQGQTLYPFLLGDQVTLEYALRGTHWDQLKLVPANLFLYEAEYVIAGHAAGAGRAGVGQFLRLRDAIATVSEQFDVIVIDAPPALGMISLSVINAANALVVPVRPATVDFASTVHFFTMLIETYEGFVKYGMPEPRFKFLKVLANDMDETKSAHAAICEVMQKVYGTAMLSTVVKDSAEIDNAGARLKTVYELEGPITSPETHKRCRAYLNAANREIELLIRKTWPSHYEALRKEGLV